MKLEINILRRKNAEDAPHWEVFPYETEDEGETVAAALLRINESTALPVRFECSCLQKKCGACAMVIDGRPALACDCFLKDYDKCGALTLEPLTIFPVVADLIVDRGVMYENLRKIGAWSEGEIAYSGRELEDAYDASRCLQCGCCLEVCPNFLPGDAFFGAAGMVPESRLICGTAGEAASGNMRGTVNGAKDRIRIRESYRRHIYKGCGKSLACRDICPAGIDIERLLSRSNRLAVWRRHR